MREEKRTRTVGYRSDRCNIATLSDMELTPQALHDVEFREARRGGYNTRDVDDFLERVAIGVGQLQDRLREAYHRAEAAEARLADMQRQIDELQRRGPERESSP